MRRKTWKLNRLTAVAAFGIVAFGIAAFAAVNGAFVSSLLAQERLSGANTPSPSPVAATPTAPVIRCRAVPAQGSPASSTFAVYASDGTRTSRSLKLAQTFTDPKQAVAKSLELRKTCSQPCVVEWKGGQEAAEYFHPTMRTPKVENCSVYTMTCSRTGWLETKTNLTRKDAETWAETNRPKYLRVEVVYHVAAR